MNKDHNNSKNNDHSNHYHHRNNNNYYDSNSSNRNDRKEINDFQKLNRVKKVETRLVICRSN